MMSRPSAVSVAAWLAGACAAVAVGIQSLSAIGAGLTVGAVAPLLPAQGYPAVPPAPTSAPDPVPTSTPAPTATTAAPSRTPQPRPTATPARPPTSETRVISSVGGTAIVRCQSVRAYLVSWSPLPGFRATEVIRGPEPTVEVKFRGEELEIEIDAWCVDGVPDARVEQEKRKESDESDD